jgi:hypothetical protein
MGSVASFLASLCSTEHGKSISNFTQKKIYAKKSVNLKKREEALFDLVKT